MSAKRPKKFQRFGRLLTEGIKTLASAMPERSLRAVMHGIANEVGYSQATIYKWREGYRVPDHETVQKLARKFAGPARKSRDWVTAFLLSTGWSAKETSAFIEEALPQISDLKSGVRLQDLRSITVKILHGMTGETVGTGTVVGAGGKIATSKGVIRRSGIEPSHAREQTLGVAVPTSPSGSKTWRARVAKSLQQSEDDLILLELIDGPDIFVEHVAFLGTAQFSAGHDFRSYGYLRQADYAPGYADGKIIGPVEPPRGHFFLCDPIQLQSMAISWGLSGAPILDVERNLVIGLLAENDLLPDLATRNPDIGWGVDMRVLTFDPFRFAIQDTPVALAVAPQPSIDVLGTRALARPTKAVVLNNSPPALRDWVGRRDLLDHIFRSWTGGHRVVGLIGLGGEGKSSLAREWLRVIWDRDDHTHKPEGIFWWGFYKRRSVDEFLEAAITFLSGGRIDPRKLPSGSLKAQVIGSMLGAGAYVFVLDGLEVFLNEDGQLTNFDLRELLNYFADAGHHSFCIVTSRVPLADLIHYLTYKHIDVDRLSPLEGRGLLRKLGVKGPVAELDQIVEDWGGHALTLTLLGSYLRSLHGGKAAKIREILPPTRQEPRYVQVQRVLLYYEHHLTAAERIFLFLFSLFRTPIRESAFTEVLRAPSDHDSINAPIAELNDRDFESMVRRLLAYSILRYNPDSEQYTLHPLIGAYYLESVKDDAIQLRAFHDRVKEYYLGLAGELPQSPAIQDLVPLIEAVHHACRGGKFDEAGVILWDRIYQGQDRRVPVHELGSFETIRNLMLEFFPSGDISREPLMTDPEYQHLILNDLGLALVHLGSTEKGTALFERAITVAQKAAERTDSKESWSNASISYQNLAEHYANLGALSEALEAAEEAIKLAKKAENLQYECWSFAYRGWVAYLSGDLENAGRAFQRAENLQRQYHPEAPFLYDLRGIQHATLLRRNGDADYAWRVAQNCLSFGERRSRPGDLSRAHRMLGDLSSDLGDHDNARIHYIRAFELSRRVYRQDILIEALIGRGSWAARRGRIKDARVDLDEALTRSTTIGYRIYEANARLALIPVYLAISDKTTTETELRHIERMSSEMGYHWGQVEARSFQLT